MKLLSRIDGILKYSKFAWSPVGLGEKKLYTYWFTPGTFDPKGLIQGTINSVVDLERAMHNIQEALVFAARKKLRYR